MHSRLDHRRSSSAICVIIALFITVIVCCNIKSAAAQGNISQKPLWNETQTDLLKKSLLLNYDKFARPAQHTNVTKVTFDISVLHLDIDESKSFLTVYAWSRMNWKDEKLKWNATNYGGLRVLHLAGHEVWQPDIVVYNTATGNNIDHYGNTHLIVHEDGTVLWVPPSQFTVFCELNLRDWPFDTQECILKFGSWTYDGNQIALDLPSKRDDAYLSELTITNAEWQIESFKGERHSRFYTCCEEPYFDVTFNFTLKRTAPVYRATVITPACIIIFLILSTFWLPPQAGEKIILNGIVALIICSYLMYFSFKLPPLSKQTPLIVLFYSSSLYMTCFSLIISVIVVHIARTKHTEVLPWFIKGPLTSWLGRVLWLKRCSNQNLLSHRVNAEELREHSSMITTDEHSVSDDHQMITNQSKRNSQHDWIMFATAIDRTCFLFFTIIFLLLTITYSV